MANTHAFRRAICFLAAGGASFTDTILRDDPTALLLHSKSSVSYATMRGFRIRGGGRALSTSSSGRLWAQAWSRDREKFDEMLPEEDSDALVSACAKLYTDLYDFAGLPQLREVFADFTAPTSVLRALDRVLQEPGLDLTPLERLSKPGTRLRAMNMMSETIRLPEAVVAVEATLRVERQIRGEEAEVWARTARQFLAAGVPMDECVGLVLRAGWKDPLTVFENRAIPDEYWDAISNSDSNISSKTA